MLHIFNGDSTAKNFKTTNLPGESLIWREALIEGPNPQDVNLSEWLEIRAEHLSNSVGKDKNKIQQSLQKQADTLRTFTNHEEVVLWFEYDLFCQVNLTYLLNFFTQNELGKTKLSLICIDEFPDVVPFYGFGQLNSGQLSSLFDKRKPVSAKALHLANKAWKAYSSTNPQDIETLLKGSTDELPYLEDAFFAHLARFPSLRNGLGTIENKTLDLIASGVDEFKPLFPIFQELHSIYGLGDHQFWMHLYNLSKVSNPLLEIFTTNGYTLKDNSYEESYFKLTRTGKAILVGNSDMLNLNHVDYWLGGVHISHENEIWRWDENQNKIIRDEDHF